MGAGDVADDEQAEPVALVGRDWVRGVVGGGRGGGAGGGEAGAAVRDAEEEAGRGGLKFEEDVARGWGEAEGVVEEISQGLFEQSGRSVHLLWGGGKASLEADVGGFEGGAEVVGEVAGEFGEVEPLERALEVGAGEPGEQQQLIDRVPEAAGLFDHRPEGFPVLGGRTFALEADFAGGAEGGERVAQLVGGIEAEAIDALEDAAIVVEGLVQGHRQLAQFIGGDGGFDALVEAALADGAGGAEHAAEGLQPVFGQQPGGDAGYGQYAGHEAVDDKQFLGFLDDFIRVMALFPEVEGEQGGPEEEVDHGDKAEQPAHEALAEGEVHGSSRKR